jgi:hypothetical protein
MIRLLVVCGAMGLVCGLAGPVAADDSMARATPTDHQMLKDCIEKQKSKNVTMSKAEMKRFCKDELKRQKDTGAMPNPPPADEPRP